MWSFKTITIFKIKFRLEIENNFIKMISFSKFGLQFKVKSQLNKIKFYLK